MSLSTDCVGRHARWTVGAGSSAANVLCSCRNLSAPQPLCQLHRWLTHPQVHPCWRGCKPAKQARGPTCTWRTPSSTVKLAPSSRPGCKQCDKLGSNKDSCCASPRMSLACAELEHTPRAASKACASRAHLSAGPGCPWTPRRSGSQRPAWRWGIPQATLTERKGGKRACSFTESVHAQQQSGPPPAARAAPPVPADPSQTGSRIVSAAGAAAAPSQLTCASRGR